jgi:hypothetical protein
MVVSLIIDPSDVWNWSQRSECDCVGLPGMRLFELEVQIGFFRYVDSPSCTTAGSYSPTKLILTGESVESILLSRFKNKITERGDFWL